VASEWAPLGPSDGGMDAPGDLHESTVRDMTELECPDPGAPTSETDTPGLAGYIWIAADEVF